MKKVTLNESTTPPLTWELDVPLLTHPVMLKNFVTLWIVSGVIMLALVGGIVGVREGIKAFVAIAEMILLIIGGLSVLSLLVMLVVFGNRMRMAFAIDDRGIVARVVDSRAKVANRLAAVVGVVAGRPGVAGAGLIAMHDEERTAVWSGIAEARYDPRRYTITLRNAWRPILHVYCTSANYEQAALRVAAGLAGSSRPAGAWRNPLWGSLGLTVVVVLAILPLFGMPYPFETPLFVVIFTLCFAIATVWLLPVMAWAVLGGVCWTVGIILMRGIEPKTNQLTGGAYTSFELIDSSDLTGLTVAAIGLGVLVWISIAALRGRISSLLMRDTEEMVGGKRS
jgi:hypothetical protein